MDPKLQSARGLAAHIHATPQQVTDYAKALGIAPAGPYRNSPSKWSAAEIVAISGKHLDHLKERTAAAESKAASINAERVRVATLMSHLADLTPIDPNGPDCRMELRELREALKGVPAKPKADADYQTVAKFQNSVAVTLPSINPILNRIGQKLNPKA